MESDPQTDRIHKAKALREASNFCSSLFMFLPLVLETGHLVDPIQVCHESHLNLAVGYIHGFFQLFDDDSFKGNLQVFIKPAFFS